MVPGLRSIKLGYGINSDALLYLARNLSCLTVLELDLDRFGHAKTAREMLFAQRGPQLRHLNADLCGEEHHVYTCRSILEHCTQLSSLKLSVSKLTLDVLGGAPNSFQNTQLELACRYIKEDSLLHIIAASHLLRQLTLEHSPLSDEGVAHVLRHCSQLEKFCARRCWKVGDLTAAALAEHCPKLNQLELIDTEITDSGMSSLAAGHFVLQRLHLRCGMMSNDGLLALLAMCPQLLELEIVDCVNITDVAMEPLPRLCPKLVRFSLDTVRTNITAVALRRLIAECPRLRYVKCPPSLRGDAVDALKRAGKFRTELNSRYDDVVVPFS